MRETRRSWPSSVLVILLVLLPMAAVSAAAVFASSLGPTPEQHVDAELGDADAWLRTATMAEGMRQSLTDPMMSFGEGTEGAMVEPPDSVESYVDADRLISIAHGTATTETATGLATMWFAIGDAWDPLLDGRYTMLAGHVPEAPDEVLATPSALERLGAEIGEEVSLAEPEATVTVVGTLSSRLEPDKTEVLFSRSDGPVSADQAAGTMTWFAEGWHPTRDEVYDLNDNGIVVYDRILAQSPGEDARAFDTASGTAWAVVSAAIAGLVFSTYLVLLLAGAAFSVSAKRQHRALAVAASVGASRTDVFRIVLLQGTILGFVGGIVGIALGIGIGSAALHTLDTGDTLQYSWGVRVPWLPVTALAVFSAIVGTLAALIPARRATQGDTLGALRGGRRPLAISARRPRVGAALLILGLALSATATATLIATYNSPLHQSPSANVIYSVSMGAMILGPLLLQIGVITAGHWLLSLAARALARVGVAARIATRDAVANPGRSVPSFGAIAACAFIATASFGGVAIVTSAVSASFTAQAPADTMVVSVGSEPSADGRADPDAADGVVEAAVELLRDAGAARTAVISAEPPASIDPDTGQSAPAESDVTVRPEHQTVPDWCADDGDCQNSAVAGNHVTPRVIAPGDIETVLGMSIPDGVRAAFADGHAIVTDPSWIAESGEVVFHTWHTADVIEPELETLPEAVSSQALAAEMVTPPIAFTQSEQVFVSPAGAAELGIEYRPERVFGSYAEGPTVGQQDEIAAGAERLSDDLSSSDGRVYVSAWLPNQPPESASWLWLILGAVSVLVVAASAVALGLSRVERRPDDATLAAVGAQPGVRRAVSAWQALVIAGFGCVTGAVAGLVPIVGAALIIDGTTGDGFSLAKVPWTFIGLLAVAVPLAITIVSLLVPLHRADLTRRTAIA